LSLLIFLFFNAKMDNRYKDERGIGSAPGLREKSSGEERREEEM